MIKRTLLLVAVATTTNTLACSAVEDPDDGIIEERNAVEHPLEEVLGADSTILAELQSPGGSTLAFVLEPSGTIGVLEHGLDGSIPVGSVEELLDATPLEVFLAVAPADEEPPLELVADHELLRSLVAGESSVPEGFHVSELPGFAVGDQAFRSYSSCTDISGWQDATNGKPVGPNCKAGGTCITNVTANFMGCLPGGGCYPTGWNQRMRWSTCNRGTGTYRAGLNTFPGDGSYLGLVDLETSAAGAYYLYWRYVPGNDDKWSMFKWDLSGDPKGHFSLWGEL